jgi:hypothetical protein
MTANTIAGHDLMDPPEMDPLTRSRADFDIRDWFT